MLTFHLIAFSGIVVHFIARLRDAQTKGEVFDWKKNLMFTLYVFAIVMVMVTFRADIGNILGRVGVDISQLVTGKLIWFFVGYFGDSIWKNIESSGAATLKVEDKPNV